MARPAFAQEAAGTSAEKAATTPSEPSADEGSIVVTGLKRNSRLIDTPVAVSVFSEVNIEQAGIRVPTDFLALTPNVNITTSVNPGDFLINIRGQSSIRGAEPAVAIIIDGARVGSPAEFNTALFDLEQIEVFKGPQGPIYGRNASAGAIVLTTKRPTREWTGSGLVSYGNLNAYEAQLSVSGGLTDNLLMRASADFKGTDGSYTNVNTGEKSQRYEERSGRLRLLYDDGGPFVADAKLTYINGRGGSHYYTAKIGPAAGLSPNGTIVGGKPVTDISADHNLDVPFTTDVPGRYKREIWSGSLRLTYDLGGAELASVTSYADTYETLAGKNFPYTSALDPNTNYFGWAAVFGDKIQGSRSKTKQFQQELRITSTGKGFLEYQAGVEFTYRDFYYSLFNNLNGGVPAGLMGNPALLAGYNGYNGAGQRTLLGGGNLPPNATTVYDINSAYPTTNYQDDRFIARNYAPFANVTLNFTDKLSLRLAGRYDIEKRRVASVGLDAPNPFNNGQSFNSCVRINGLSLAECKDGLRRTFRQFQPKATLNYLLPGGGSLYASYGRGFKSGGFNPIGTRELTVQGVTQQNVALGLAPAAARAAAEGSVITQDFYRKEVSSTYEAGFKVELFDRRLYVDGAVFLTDIDNGQLYVFDPLVNIQSIQSIDKERVKGFELSGNLKIIDPLSVFASWGLIDARIRRLDATPSAEGNRPPYVSRSSFSAGAQVATPLSDSKNLIARAEYARTGPTYYSLDNDPGFRRGAYDLVNARIGISTDKWDATLWGRNIFDKRYVNEIAPIISGVATALSLAQGRSYGVEFKYKF